MRSATVLVCAIVWLGGMRCVAQPFDNCELFGEQVREQTRKLTAPPGWNVQVICGQEQWAQLLLKTHLTGKADRALTGLEMHTTFLYAGGFRGDLAWADVYRTLAHEIAHILCACPSEETARWMAGELMAHKGWRTATGRHIAPATLMLIPGPGGSVLYRHKVSGELFVLNPERVLVAGQLPQK